MGADRRVLQRVRDQGDSLGDRARVPAAAVLLRDRHECPVGASPCRRARVREQHQREEAGDVAVVGQPRVPGCRRPASANKTVAAPLDRAFAAFTEPKLRQRWLPGAQLRERTSPRGRSARFDREDGAMRVLVGFDAKGAGKPQPALGHERRSDAGAAQQMKTFWRERMAAIKALLAE